MSARRRKVVILGGGIAGLAAAHALRRDSPHTALCLLEAREVLGGRVSTIRDPLTDEPLELGAEFVHGKPPSLLRVLRQARIALDTDDTSRPSANSPFTLMPKLLAPLLTPGVPDVTIEAFFARQRIAPATRQMLQGFVNGFYLAPAKTASARAIARMEVAATQIGGEGGAQVPGGYDALTRFLARALVTKELRLGTVATAVRWRPGRVTVESRSLAGAKLKPLTADAVIVALPFPALAPAPSREASGALALQPAVAEKREAARALRMGHATKVFVRLDGGLRVDPFFYTEGPIPVWWSGAAPDSRWLVGWAGGRNAQALEGRAPQAIQKLALAAIATHLGGARAKEKVARALTGFRVQSWAREPFIEGAYAYVPLGADGAMSTLAQPVAATLFFAGEHTNPEHAGTVHGALESGLRAAREVLSALAG